MNSGVVVTDIEEGSLAESSGLQPGDVVLELNRQALRQLRCKAHLEIIPGATHLFEEPGTLEQVVTSAGSWFLAHVPEG